MNRPLVIVDGDDTLWWSEALYDAARKRAGEIVAAVGLDAVEWERLERRLDVENVGRFGLSSERFPTSCAEAYRKISAAHGKPPDEKIFKRVYEAAASVFETEAPLVDGVGDALEQITSFAELALLTKGDEEVQQKRIVDSGLSGHFSHIEVVDNKTSDSFEKVLDYFEVPAQVSWSIGNSLRSDILPAVEIGMNAVWIDAHVWEHERSHPPVVHPRIYKCEDISEAARTIWFQSTQIRTTRSHG